MFSLVYYSVTVSTTSRRILWRLTLLHVIQGYLTMGKPTSFNSHLHIAQSADQINVCNKKYQNTQRKIIETDFYHFKIGQCSSYLWRNLTFSIKTKTNKRTIKYLQVATLEIYQSWGCTNSLIYCSFKRYRKIKVYFSLNQRSALVSIFHQNFGFKTQF